MSYHWLRQVATQKCLRATWNKSRKIVRVLLLQHNRNPQSTTIRQIMLCEQCHQNPATNHVAQFSGQEFKTSNLCAECAAPILEKYRSMKADFASKPPGLDHPMFDKEFSRMATQDDRFTMEAFRFVVMAVSRTLVPQGPTPSNVSGRQIALSFRDLALEKFGPRALQTLDGWGLRSTADIGTVVFRMIDFRLLKRGPDDSLEDYADVYDFAEAFPE